LPPRDDVGYWDDKYQAEFDKGIKIWKHCPSGIKTRVIAVIKRYWDNFYKAGACRTIRGFEFVIDTGDATPVCCRFPVYGLHESKIINQQLEVLRSNFWSRRYGGPWGSMIVLAPKPHQENIDDIKDFIWRMCVSLRRLNRCTKPFTFYHSMEGEATCGRWAFGKLKKYLYGAHFWWICDCDGMRILFGYDGPIKQLRRWGQEMLGYNCTLLHRSHQLMRDVDAINRRYEPGLIKTYMTKEAALHNDSRRRHPNSYVIPNLRYFNRHLAADPPHISDINAGDPVAALTLIMTLC
jgi:hypothetical protein